MDKRSFDDRNNSVILLIDSGGLSHYTTYLAVGLAKYRNIILYGFSDEQYTITGASKQRRIKFSNIGKRLPKGTSLTSSAIRPWLLLFPLLKGLIAAKFNIVHIQGQSCMFFLFIPWLKFRKKPIFWTMHDVDIRPTSPGIRGRLELLQVKLLCQNKILREQADVIIVHGTKLKDQLISKGVCKNKIHVVPHFDYKYLLTDSNTHHYKTNGYVLLFGKIKPYKGIDIFLNASRIARKKLGGKFRVVIAGKGNMSYFANQLTTEDLTYIDVRNEFIPDSEIPELFRKASFVVLPYKDGSQSGVMSLAYTFSKPVIVSNVGSIPEYVENGITGFIFEKNDALQLANYIIELVENHDTCIQMGKNAHQKMLNEMSLEKCSAIINRLYSEINK